MINNLVRQIKLGKYEQPSEVFKNMDEDSQKKIITEVSSEDHDISAYGFLMYLYLQDENIRWEYMAIDTLLHDVGDYYDGTYAVALFHAREVLKKENTIDNMQRLLLFHELPGRLLSDEEAKSIAEDILDMEPTNEKALLLLESLK